MAVPAVNVVIEKGTDFSTNFILKNIGSPIDLSGYTFSSKMRKHYDADNFYSFNVETVGALSEGTIKVGMASSITSTIPVGRYVYDVLITSSGIVRKVIEGNVLVKGTAS